MDISSSAELRAFDATALTGSMSAAARRLGIRQPTVSAHIANLERTFRVELFYRHGRRIVLTEFGALLHEVTNRIYRSEALAIEMLHGARNGYHGLLRIGAVGPYNLSPMVKRFRDRCPQARVAVNLAHSREVVARVLDMRDDIGVLLHAVSDGRVYCRPYRRQALVVFAPAGHELAQRRKLLLKDLQGLEFVLREDGSSTRRKFENGLAAAGISVRSSVVMGSREAVREAVAQGLGLGVVAHTAFQPDPRLAVLDIADMAMYTHVHVICLRESLEHALVSAFLAAVSDCASEGLPSAPQATAGEGGAHEVLSDDA